MLRLFQQEHYGMEPCLFSNTRIHKVSNNVYISLCLYQTSRIWVIAFKKTRVLENNLASDLLTDFFNLYLINLITYLRQLMLMGKILINPWM